jgi:formylglycine-generating enzyme required for sulfatase activity
VFWQRLDLSRDEIAAGGSRNQRVDPPFSPPDGGFGHEGYPIGCVTLGAAKKYCVWLSKVTGRKFRLPTEAEWEYACRAGGPPVKMDAKQLGEMAWFAENSGDEPHPVGTRRANGWGLYDMLGNVAEYVIRDPADEKGVVAGGSYKDDAKDVHCRAREAYSPEWQKDDEQDPKSGDWLRPAHHVGFRVVMEE